VQFIKKYNIIHCHTFFYVSTVFSLAVYLSLLENMTAVAMRYFDLE
jgi:hypothetical protein